VCIPLGVWKAVKHGSTFDTASSVIVFIGYSIPGWALGAVLLVLLGGGSFWDVFPLGGFRSEDWEFFSLGRKIWDQVYHTILPIIAWEIGSFASMTILMKNSLMENLSSDYVRTAFSKGLSERRVVFLHALRNSLIPLATGLGHLIGIIFVGSYLIEKVFNIDGFGLLGFNSLIHRDYPVVLASMVIGSVIRLLGNILSDMIYAAIDPRIRFK
jgi:microcin C transport system permease protein